MKQHGGKREGAGRPSLPPEVRKVKVTVTIAAADYEWLKQRNEKVSRAIQQLIRDAREREQEP